MHEELQKVKIGLALVLLSLAFGVGMGISFGLNEDAYKSHIAEQVQAHPEVHDEKSKDKIWRYAQRAHKFRVRFGEPMYLEGHHQAEDAIIEEQVGRVRDQISLLLEEGLAERQSWFS